MRHLLQSRQCWWLTVAASTVSLLIGLSMVYRRQIARHRIRDLDAIRLQIRNSQEVFDTLLQSILGTVWQIDAAVAKLPSQPDAVRKQVEFHLNRLDVMLSELRQSVWDIQFESDRCLNLAAQIQVLAGSLLENTALRVDIRTEGKEQRLRPHVHHALMLLVKEALLMIREAPWAERLQIDVSFHDEGFFLRILDKGFDINRSQVSFEFSNRALTGLQDRIRQVGGELLMQNDAGEGTILEFRIEGRRAYPQADFATDRSGST